MILFLIISLFSSGVLYSQNDTEARLLKKWKFEKYELPYGDYPPEKKEEKDFFELFQDGKYSALSEGKKDNGQWQYLEKGNILIFTSEYESGELKMLIRSLDYDRLVLSIIDSDDPDSEYLLLHFIHDSSSTE